MPSAIVTGPACTACAKTKRRCSRQTPTCQRCRVRHLACHYPSPKPSQFVAIPSTSVHIDELLSELNLPYPSPQVTFHNDGPRDDTTYDGLNLAALSSSALDHHTSTDWFLAPETWTTHPLDLPCGGSEATNFSAGELKRYTDLIFDWLRRWAATGSNPFIHPELYCTRFPSYLQAAYTAMSSYANRTPANTSIILRIVDDHARELLGSSSARLLDTLGSNGARQTANVDLLLPDPLEHLAHIQALMVYQAIGLFDGDVRARHHAEKRFNTLNRWTSSLIARAGPELSLLSSVLDPLGATMMAAAYLPASLPQPAQLRHHWHTWILAESVRRTWHVALGLQAIFFTLKQGWTPCPGSIQFTAGKGVWEAATALEWERRCAHGDVWFVQRGEAERLLSTARPADIDEFGQSILEITYGTEMVDRWRQPDDGGGDGVAA
ncbi:hypothetical protein BX600DRAFT_452079 [Xylariales sp. PMI_506]|nr:hypothetical protein BX600DRAFT_452079 [Xylariales sp. PMI_506]